MFGKSIFTSSLNQVSHRYIAEVKSNLTLALIGCFMVKRFITLKVDSCDKTFFFASLRKGFKCILTKLRTLQRPLCLANSNGTKSIINAAVIILLGNGTLSAMLNEFAKQKDLRRVAYWPGGNREKRKRCSDKIFTQQKH